MIDVFFEALVKAASTAVGRYLARQEDPNKVGSKIVDAMRVGKIRSREFKIKDLGRGGTQRAELVASPEFGVSVRKHFMRGVPSDFGTKKHSLDPLTAHLGQKHYSSITGFLGERGTKLPAEHRQRYWEFAAGAKSQPKAVRHAGLAKYIESKHSWTRTDIDRSKHPKWMDEDAIANRYRRMDSAKYGPYRRRHEHATLTPGQRADMAAVKKMFPRAHDYEAHRNIVGGKIVDMDSNTMKFTMMREHKEDYPEAHARKVFRTDPSVSKTPVGRQLTGDHGLPVKVEPQHATKTPALATHKAPPIAAHVSTAVRQVAPAPISARASKLSGLSAHLRKHKWKYGLGAAAALAAGGLYLAHRRKKKKEQEAA